MFDEVLGFMTSALQTHEADQTTIAGLNQKLAQHEKVTLEKVAAVQRNALDTDRIPSVVDTMIGLKLCTPLEGSKIASKLKEDPNSVFDLLVKVADTLATPSEGQEFLDSVERRGDDQDGWFAKR